MQNVSISGAIRYRFALYIRNTPTKKLARDLGVIYLCLTTIVTVAYPSEMFRFLVWFLTFDSFLFVKVFCSLFAIFRWKSITRYIVTHWETNTSHASSCEHMCDWFDVERLKDFILDRWAFPRVEVERVFCAPRYRVTKMWQALERLWVLERWANNALLLKKNRSREYLDRIFYERETLDGIGISDIDDRSHFPPLDEIVSEMEKEQECDVYDVQG